MWNRVDSLSIFNLSKKKPKTTPTPENGRLPGRRPGSSREVFGAPARGPPQGPEKRRRGEGRRGREGGEEAKSERARSDPGTLRSCSTARSIRERLTRCGRAGGRAGGRVRIARACIVGRAVVRASERMQQGTSARAPASAHAGRTRMPCASGACRRAHSAWAHATLVRMHARCPRACTCSCSALALARTRSARRRACMRDDVAGPGPAC